ncbi:MAG: ACT domain-containing protein [Phycisphaerae bacterium]
MERCVQFSIFLANKPGVLSRIFREVAKAKINVISIAMADSIEHGVLRMIVEAPDAARPILKGLGIPVKETGVLTVSLDNRPGAVADLCERLSVNHVSIGYMYCTAAVRGGKSLAVLKVPNIKKAIKVLESPKDKRRDMKVKLRRPTGTRC